jgi:hypothetical protein
MKRKMFWILGMFLTLGLLGPPRLMADNQTDELYTRRFAFLVGANNGGKDRVTLRYAEDDARAIQEVLGDMGGILPGDSHFLTDPSKEIFFEEIQALTEDVAKAKEKFRRVEVIFYYSGHSDEENIFLGNERISYKEFRELITSMNADVRIAIVDSCASGALTLPKGVIKKSPFLMDTAYDMKGYAFITSSSASEAAQESSRLKRSFFTHNLISAMRGAADMNQDGRITLNEAYQFAFDGTLTQTEKTMAGPQHPSYHIQMSGTGDVVITEIWKSTAVLVLKKDITGKIYIHNQENVLVVELKKSAGREISIGLEAGNYRIINIGSNGIYESKVTVKDGKSLELGKDRFIQTDKIPTSLRGSLPETVLDSDTGTKFSRWRIEIFGGFASMNPEDLNLRVKFDDMYAAFYLEDYFRYQENQGEISSFMKMNDGGKARLLKHSVPLGIRLRYGINGWLDLSLGFSYFSCSQNSSFENLFEVSNNNGVKAIYTDEYTNYKLAAEGFIPSLGIHLGKSINSYMRLETYITGGPLFAQCMYSINYKSQWPSYEVAGDFRNMNEGLLEEKGSGIGLAFHAGAKFDFYFTKKFGFFLDGGYAYQTVSEVSGPGTRTDTSNRDYWDEEWALKQDIRIEPWGTARFLWPSNGWTAFGGTWWRARDFELDLSGFQLRVGVLYRF